jgi:predicted nuclease of predicted toxin-antitoxin system
MKFVTDVNVPRPLINRLQAEGHEIMSIIEVNRRLSDRSILRAALDQQALVLTFDRDFRYHILQEKHTSLGVVLVRLARMRGEAETERVMQVIGEYSERLWQLLTIIYPDRVEQHPL